MVILPQKKQFTCGRQQAIVTAIDAAKDAAQIAATLADEALRATKSVEDAATVELVISAASCWLSCSLSPHL